MTALVQPAPVLTAALVLAFAALACRVQVGTPTPTQPASATSTPAAIEYVLLGDAWIRDGAGRAIGHLYAGSRVQAYCNGAERCELVGGGTVLAACLTGKGVCK